MLSTTFAALSDPTRRAILARLADGPATVAAVGRRRAGPTFIPHPIVQQAGYHRVEA